MDSVYRLLAFGSGMVVSVEQALTLALLITLYVIARTILEAVPPLIAAYAMRQTKAKYYNYKGLTMRKDEQKDQP